METQFTELTLPPLSSDPARLTATAREFITGPPTLSLGFEWPIDGDDNRNATVAVSEGKQGEQAGRARAQAQARPRPGQGLTQA